MRRPELGWGLHPTPRLWVSANAGAGGGWVLQKLIEGNTTALAAHATANVRAIIHVTRQLYLGADLGYLHSAPYDRWKGDGSAFADDIRFRTPLLRIYAAAHN